MSISSTTYKNWFDKLDPQPVYFSWWEFLAKGGSHNNPHSKCHGKNSNPPKNLVGSKHTELIRILDIVRHHFGSAITLASVYRNPTYNKCIGGASKSYHKKFIAADCVPVNGDVKGLHKAAKAIRSGGLFKGGIGLYNTFVHIDVRGTNKDF